MSESEQTVQKSYLFWELMGVLAFAITTKEVLSLFLWKFAGPISLLLTISLVTFLYRKTGLSWRQTGLIPLIGWKQKLLVFPKAILLGIGFFIAVASTVLILLAIGFEFSPEESAGVEKRWGDVKGSLAMLLLWLGIVWTAAAFGEEMLFRGYLIGRISVFFQNKLLGNSIAVVSQGLLFGLAHSYYQGLRGFIMTTVIGLVFGAFYCIYKRNLWPLILWHGVVDTMTFSALYFDWDI